MSTVSRSFNRLRSSVQQYLFARSEGQVDSASWDEKNIRKEIEKGMDDRLGEVSARHHAARIGSNYVQMSEEEQLLFLSLLATDYGPDKAAIDAAIDRYQNSDETGEAAATAHASPAVSPRSSPRRRGRHDVQILPSARSSPAGRSHRLATAGGIARLSARESAKRPCVLQNYR